MRLSNFTEVLGGANSLVAEQIVQGAARHITFTIGGDTPVDLTGYTLAFDTIQAVTPTLTRSRGSFTVAPLTVEDGAVPISRDALATISDAAGGVIDLYIPEDYFTGTVPFDMNTNVPCVVGNLRYTDTATTNPETGVIRVIMFIRFGVVA